MWINMDMFGITLKDIMMGYLCRTSFGYFRISQDIYLRYLFKDMSKKISWITKDILRYLCISFRILRYPEISWDIPSGELPDVSQWQQWRNQLCNMGRKTTGWPFIWPPLTHKFRKQAISNAWNNEYLLAIYIIYPQKCFYHTLL